MGCVTPIGLGREAFTESLRTVASGIRDLTLCDPRPYQCQVAAEVRDFDPLDHMDLREARSLPRVAQFAVAAARMALKDAGISNLEDPTRAGVVIGTSCGPLAYALEQHSIFLERGARRMHPSSPAFAHNSVIASECAIQLNVHGPVLTLSSACTSGADAIGLGRMMIVSGLADILLVGGAEAPMTPSLFAAFDRLGMMPTKYNDRPDAAARPFDVDRDGPVLGEGAVIFVLESEQHARRRGARLFAAVSGYGATCDASSHFHQEPSGVDAARAIREALNMSRIVPDELDYVNAHGTGTRENDPFESRVLHCVLGSRALRVPVSSSKSQFGHLLGAAGAIEAAAVISAMNSGFVPVTRNLERPDPECDLRHVMGQPESMRVDVALSTNFGFGSRNAALVFRSCEN